MNLFWEFYQQSRISKAESTAARSAEKAVDVANTIHYLEDRIDRLILINMALWSLIKDHSDLSEEVLLERIKEIDLTDGKLDGKVRYTSVKCRQCGRIMSNKHNRCLYCGYEPDTSGAFDPVT